jgi:hypothetical protein
MRPPLTVRLHSHGGWGDFLFHLEAAHAFHRRFPAPRIACRAGSGREGVGRALAPFVDWDAPPDPAPAATVSVRWFTTVTPHDGALEDYVGDVAAYRSFDAARRAPLQSLRGCFDAGLTLAELAVRSWGLEAPPAPLSWPPSALPGRDALPAAVGDRPYVVVCNDVDATPSPLPQTKQLPPALWRPLLAAVADSGLRVVEVGARRAAGRAPSPHLDLAGATTVEEWIALLAHAEGVLAVEGGTAHMAAVVGTPAVVLCGPTDAAAYGRPLHRYLRSGICSPCHWTTPDWFVRCPLGVGAACMYGFDPDRVAAELLDLVRSRAPRGAAST